MTPKWKVSKFENQKINQVRESKKINSECNVTSSWQSSQLTRHSVSKEVRKTFESIPQL